ARDHVLDVPGEQVAVVRVAVGEGGPVVEDVLLGVGPVPVGRTEGVALVPPLEHPLLECRERLRLYARPAGKVEQRVDATGGVGLRPHLGRTPRGTCTTRFVRSAGPTCEQSGTSRTCGVSVRGTTPVDDGARRPLVSRGSDAPLRFY